MTECVRLEVDTVTIRIPMRLQRRGGRKLIMASEGIAMLTTKPRPDPDQGAGSRASLAAGDRQRSGEVDHRPCRAGGHHGRLRLLASPADLLGARYCGSDPGWAAAEGAEVG
jgi:hypothetical protein